jgi:hypothetical protein
MTYKEKDYLITTDYRSNFWEIDYLPDTKAKTIITKVKAHFDIVVPDSATQFIGSEFQSFSRKWGFEITPSSPYHHQSNGKAESAVKRAKRMLRKTKASGEDQYLALLNIRNTPTQGIGTSPAQRLLGRRTKTTLPTKSSLLEPRDVTSKVETDQLRKLQQRQAYYYNKSAHDLPPLLQGDTVRMKPFKLGDKKWKKATVTERLDQRSYDVTVEDGATYRRNRVHLKKTAELPPMITAETNFENSNPKVSSTPERQEVQLDAGVPDDTSDTHTTPRKLAVAPRRSSRVVKTPQRYKDYQM